jgi:hypothetical protein
MRLFYVAFVAAFAIPTAPALAQNAPAAAGPRPDSLGLSRQYTTWFYAAQTDSLWAHTSERMRADIQSPDWWRERADQLAIRAGSETAVIEERFRMRNGRPQYWRTARFSDFGEPMLVRFVLNDQGLLDGFGLGPLSNAPPTDN